ncbi:MAG: hypothetical protein ACPGF7_10795 [Pontibacterium sp.]
MTSTQITSTLASWSLPDPLVGSGHDARSSENGLLTILYAGLERASQLEWLNAGRTLVDKTYVNILWQAAELPSIGVTSQRIASELDAFVRAHLQPLWLKLEHLSHEEKHSLSVSLVETCAGKVFGSGYHEEAASWLLYYLCPQLPVFPMSETLNASLNTGLNQTETSGSYKHYHQRCRQYYSLLLPHLHSTTPKAAYGNPREIDIVNQVLKGSDWWQRRCFVHYLRQD